MSDIELSTVKRALKVTHTADDDDLQRILDGAEDEAKRWLGRTQLPTLPIDSPDSEDAEEIPSSEDPVAPAVVDGVILLCSAGYDAQTADDKAALRRVAFSTMHPYRLGLGA